MISTNELKNGFVLDIDGELVSVVQFQHVKPGKGGAFVRTKLKSLSTGAVVDRTFRAGEKLERVTTETRTMQFLYRDGDDLLAPNTDVQVLFVRGAPIKIELPTFVELEVVRTDPGVKGDTVSNVTKPAELESGATVDVPLFVNEGDRLKIDTRTREYSARA